MQRSAMEAEQEKDKEKKGDGMNSGQISGVLKSLDRTLDSMKAPKVDTKKTSVVKFSEVIEACDGTETMLRTSVEIRVHYANYKAVKKGPPLAADEPSEAQISALHFKVVMLKATPYVGFALSTPFGQRAQKLMRFRRWVPQPDGTSKAVDVPGPPDFEAWWACWRCYVVTMLMLAWEDLATPEATEAVLTPPATTEVNGEAVITTAALEAYFDGVSQDPP